MIKPITVDQLAELAMDASEFEKSEFEDFKVNEYAMYKMMAAHVLDEFASKKETDNETLMLIIITKLMVENFVLHTKVLRDD